MIKSFRSFISWSSIFYSLSGLAAIVAVIQLSGVTRSTLLGSKVTSYVRSRFSVPDIQNVPYDYTADSKTKITLVTAYFNIGTVKRERKGEVRTNAMYHGWAEIYKHVENPLVCYTDDEILFKKMMSFREGKENKTKLFLIDRNSTWAFQREPRVREIFSQPGYPRSHPFTGTSAYPCIQFAKYDLVVRAAEANYFKTKYIAWIDIGHFKEKNSKRDFELVKLDSHDDKCIAMSLVYDVRFDVTPKEIFYNNKQWVGGAFSLGTREVMVKFANQLKRAVIT